MSVFPFIHLPGSEVTPIFLIFVNQLLNKCLIIVLICIPLIANEDEQSLRFGGRWLYSMCKNSVHAFDWNDKIIVALQLRDPQSMLMGTVHVTCFLHWYLLLHGCLLQVIQKHGVQTLT